MSDKIWAVIEDELCNSPLNLQNLDVLNEMRSPDQNQDPVEEYT